jgi:hypothetical protein
MAVPYILVDNPMSYAGGREDYGYPKTMGIFDPPGGDGDPQSVQAFGGDFEPTSRAGWHELFRISRGTGAKPAKPAKADKAPKEPADKGASGKGAPWHPLHTLAQRLGALSTDELAKLAPLPSVSLLGDFAAAIAGEQISQVFLKQFRDVRADTDAVYQAVVEAPIRFLSTSVRPSLEPWSVEITPLDSHPIARELGVVTQTTRLSFEVKMDMIAEPGRVVAP